jgi:hypothetical protein
VDAIWVRPADWRAELGWAGSCGSAILEKPVGDVTRRIWGLFSFKNFL